MSTLSGPTHILQSSLPCFFSQIYLGKKTPKNIPIFFEEFYYLYKRICNKYMLINPLGTSQSSYLRVSPTSLRGHSCSGERKAVLTSLKSTKNTMKYFTITEVLKKQRKFDAYIQ
jgi:hypothetical protein